MRDPRLEKLGDLIVNHSCEVKQGERVLIESSRSCAPLINYIISKCYERGALPFVLLKESDIQRELLRNISAEQINIQSAFESVMMSEMDVYIEIKDDDNLFELSDIPPEKWNLYHNLYYKPVHWDIRLPKTKWVTVRYPSKVFAQKFGMSTEKFENFYFNTVLADYGEMGKLMLPLKERMDKANRVKILTPTTNLDFNIGKYKAVICNGKINLPDGEVFIAPELESVNGTITYNADVLYQDITFSNIKLDFKDGKVIKAESGSTTRDLNRILDTDAGARYVGEFAFGTNPKINRIVKNIIYDEKMLGSIHLALGASHPTSNNGNESGIHWDMVQIHKKENGGGQIFFDDELIMQDGIFVPSDLQELNQNKTLKLTKK